MINKLKESIGITLIALVITIIVLLILAGVAISMLAGDNGILRQAVKAKEAMERAQILEAAQLAYMSAQMNNEDIEEAIENLRKQGYKIQRHSLDFETIKSIKYMLNNGEIEETTIKKENEIEIDLSTEIEQSNNVNYYIEINNKYYLLTMNSEEVAIGDTEVDISSLENNIRETITEVTSSDTLKVTVALNDAKTNIKITGVNAGETVITTKTSLGKEFNLKVTVTNNATGITISSTEGNSINVGSSTTLTAILSPIDASDTNITWSVGDLNIAQLSRTDTAITNGTASVVVTGKSAGSTTITAKSSSGVIQIYDLTVVVLAESISLNYTEKELTQGKTLQLVATILPSNTTDKTIKWSSSDTSIATVDSNGLVTAASDKMGTVSISAETVNGKRASVTINVIKVESILDKLTIGSIINYETLEGDYTVNVDITGIEESQNFSTKNEKVQFVVMGLDNGIEIIPLRNIGTLALFADKGTNNGCDILNGISQLYLNTEFASNVEALGNNDKVSEHAKDMYNLYKTFGYTDIYNKYKTSKSYSSRTKPISLSELNSSSGNYVWLASVCTSMRRFEPLR